MQKVDFIDSTAYSVPVKRAMLDKRFDLGKALLFEGFTGEAGGNEPGAFQDAPLLSVDEVLGSRILELNAPFDVLREALFSLVSDSSARLADMDKCRNSMLSYAKLVHNAGVGVL